MTGAALVGFPVDSVSVYHQLKSKVTKLISNVCGVAFACLVYVHHLTAIYPFIILGCLPFSCQTFDSVSKSVVHHVIFVLCVLLCFVLFCLTTGPLQLLWVMSLKVKRCIPTVSVFLLLIYCIFIVFFR